MNKPNNSRNSGGRKKQGASSGGRNPKFSKRNKSNKPFSGKRRTSIKGKSRRGRGEDIAPERFMHKGVELKEVAYQAPFPYSDFPLHENLQQNLKAIKWTHPTEVQDKSFMPISELKDIIAIANTGTGKTGAFLIPLINAMLISDPFSVLVMVPTRELAEQVEAEFKMLSKGMRLFAASFIGGKSVENDIRKLQKPFDFVIGTPGRLVDLTKRGAIKTENFSVLILDEFDRMLDMGFSADVDFMIKNMKNRDQTLLFSATLDKSQQEIIDRIMKDPEIFQISDGTSTAEHIDQDVVFVSKDAKFDVLLSMLKKENFDKVLIFAETKRTVAGLAKQLKKSKVRVDEIHGDKSQNYRKKALQDFKRGKVDVLVATDVAARGLDISDVTHVINYEVPQDYETYIHRIGRTGRAGKKGQAYTFMQKKENQEN